MQSISAGFCCDGVGLSAEILVNRLDLDVMGVGEGFDFPAGFPCQCPNSGVGLGLVHLGLVRLKALGIQLVDALVVPNWLALASSRC